jgi:hypothetical protein
MALKRVLTGRPTRIVCASDQRANAGKGRGDLGILERILHDVIVEVTQVPHLGS